MGPDGSAIGLGIGHFGLPRARFVEQGPHAIMVSIACMEEKLAILLRRSLFAEPSHSELLSDPLPDGHRPENPADKSQCDENDEPASHTLLKVQCRYASQYSGPCSLQ
jgi:hypothetical protein